MALGASMSIASLTVNGAGTPETRTFTLNNDGDHTLTLAGAGGIAINAGAGAVTLKPNLILGASQAWTNNSANLFTAGGNVSNGGNDLTIAGSGDALLTGVIGNGAGGLVKNGAGRLTVTQDHTYTGDTFLNEGSLFVENPTTGGTIRPFGFGTLHIAGGTTLGITVPNVIIPNPYLFIYLLILLILLILLFIYLFIYLFITLLIYLFIVSRRRS